MHGHCNQTFRHCSALSQQAETLRSRRGSTGRGSRRFATRQRRVAEIFPSLYTCACAPRCYVRHLLFQTGHVHASLHHENDNHQMTTFWYRCVIDSTLCGDIFVHRRTWCSGGSFPQRTSSLQTFSAKHLQTDSRENANNDFFCLGALLVVLNS